MSSAEERNTDHRRIWETKPVLREVYTDLYRKMVAECVPGLTLEIGGGSGNLKQFRSDVLTSDIAFAPWLDTVADAQCLPFVSSTFANIVMFDVLHHIEFPVVFMREAERVLVPGGRIIMVEPAITPVSWFFYHFVHEEPVLMSADPLVSGAPSKRRDPYAANQAIPTLLVTRERRRFKQQFPRLQVVKRRWLSLFAYPLSGGFKPWSLIPTSAAKCLLRVENLIAPVIGRALGFRLLIVIERSR